MPTRRGVLATIAGFITMLIFPVRKGGAKPAASPALSGDLGETNRPSLRKIFRFSGTRWKRVRMKDLRRGDMIVMPEEVGMEWGMWEGVWRCGADPRQAVMPSGDMAKDICDEPIARWDGEVYIPHATRLTEKMPPMSMLEDWPCACAQNTGCTCYLDNLRQPLPEVKLTLGPHNLHGRSFLDDCNSKNRGEL